MKRTAPSRERHMKTPLPSEATLLLIDVQLAFGDPSWGDRNNPDAEKKIAQLLRWWRDRGGHVVHVHHRNLEPGQLFSTGALTAQPHPLAAPLDSEATIYKSVNSAFIGTDLEALLRADGVRNLVVAGLTTDHCVSTTARMGGNLGFTVFVVGDATATFDRVGPDGRGWSAEEMHATALASLNQEFAHIVTSTELLSGA